MAWFQERDRAARSAVFQALKDSRGCLVRVFFRQEKRCHGQTSK